MALFHKKQLKATAMLLEDHLKLKQLFADFDHSETASGQESIVQAICMELDIHMSSEERLLYLSAKKELGDEPIIAELTNEHLQVKLLMAQLQRLTADSDQDEYCGKVRELQDAVNRQMKREREALVPMLETSGVNLVELGKRLGALRTEIAGKVPPDVTATTRVLEGGYASGLRPSAP